MSFTAYTPPDPCTCQPGHHDPKCPYPIPEDLTGRRAVMAGEDECAHCGASISYCMWAIRTANIGGCCPPCMDRPMHEHEAR